MFRKFNNRIMKREKRHKKSRPRASTERNLLKDSGKYFVETNIETPPPNYSAVASISHSVASSDIKSGRSSQSTSSSDSLKTTFNNYSGSSISSKDEKNKKRYNQLSW